MRSEPSSRSTQLPANALGVAAILSFGCLGLLGKAAATLPPLFVVSVCFAGATALGALVLLVRALRRSSWPRLDWREAVVGGVFMLGYHLLYFSSFHYAPAIEVTLLNYLWPAFVIVIGNAFFCLGAGWPGLFAAGIGFAGVVVLLGGAPDPGIYAGRGFGLLLSLLGAAVWATYCNLRRTAGGDTVATVAVICAITAALAGLASAALESPPPLTSTHLVTLVLMSLGPAGGAFYLWDVAMRRGNAAMLAVLSYSAPLVSTALLVIAGFAAPTPRIAIATLLVMLGGLVSFIVTKRSS